MIYKARATKKILLLYKKMLLLDKKMLSLDKKKIIFHFVRAPFPKLGLEGPVDTLPV